MWAKLCRSTLADFVAVRFGAHYCPLTGCFESLRSSGKVAAMTQERERRMPQSSELAGCARAHKQAAGCPRWQPTAQTEGSTSMTA